MSSYDCTQMLLQCRLLVYYRNSVKRASVNVLPENVFNRVPAELPEGQCSAVTRLKYVLWSLVYDASAYRIAVLCFSYQKRPTFNRLFITDHSHIKRGLKPQVYACQYINVCDSELVHCPIPERAIERATHTTVHDSVSNAII